jgi:UDP-N-acetylglucosamine:LPS N-acetylglucosamine transferase
MSSMIISTGGTGGHVIPAKVFYDYFKENLM